MSATAAMTAHALSKSDVERLVSSPTVDSRVGTMVKLVQDLESGALQAGERDLALEVLHCFAADAEAAVREAVAWQIHNSPLLSLDLAERLARDVARVAFPVLRHTQGLDEAFLLRILAEHDPGKQLAVAGRSGLSGVVSDVLVADGNVAVITCLLRNHSAEIGEASLRRALERFGEIRTVGTAMAARPELPLAIAEALVTCVSRSVRAALVQTYGLSPQLVDRIVGNGREAATMQLLRPLLADPVQAEMTARWLHANGRLTPSLLFRALCAGDIALAVAGLAERAGIATGNARTLAWDDGALGLRALFRRAAIPLSVLMPFRVALSVVKEMGYDGGKEGRDAFQSEVIARVFEDCTPTDEWAVDELLLQLFDQKSDEVITRAMDQAGLPFVPIR